MKKFGFIFLFTLFALALQGCYTVVWTPEIALTEREEETGSDFYPEPQYREYYDPPWWYYSTPAVIDVKKDRSREQTDLRNGGDRQPGCPTPPVERGVPLGPPATRNDPNSPSGNGQGSGSGQPSGNNQSSGGNTRTEEKKTVVNENENSSGNNSSNERKKTEERSVRNTDGHRTDNKGRK